MVPRTFEQVLIHDFHVLIPALPDQPLQVRNVQIFYEGPYPEGVFNGL